MNTRIGEHEEATGTMVTVDQYSNFLIAHEGFCYRNSKHNPASAEEYQAKEVARDLLVDEDRRHNKPGGHEFRQQLPKEMLSPLGDSC